VQNSCVNQACCCDEQAGPVTGREEARWCRHLMWLCHWSIIILPRPGAGACRAPRLVVRGMLRA